MGNTKNTYDFYGEVLTALDVDHTVADVKDREILRQKILEGLSQEYTTDDIKQTDLFRSKLVDGISNMSGGGGGSSDFSTATLTFVNSEGPSAYLQICTVIDGDGFSPCSNAFVNMSGSYDVILYKGVASGYAEGSSVTCSGDVEYDDGDVYITGDCTIAIS